MASKKIYEVAKKDRTTLTGSEKLPIDDGSGQAQTTDLNDIRDFCGQSVKETVVVTVCKGVDFPPKKLPDGYDELEYIESSGTQWIDTGIVPFDGIKAKLDIEFGTGSHTNSKVFGVGGDNGWGTYFASSSMWDNYNDDTNTTVSGTYEGTLSIVKDGNTTKITGSAFADKTITRTNTLPSQTLPIYLFNKNGSSRQLGIFKCYGLSISDADDVPLFNGIPAKRLSDGVVGMYDIVSDTFLTNQGSGEFIGGKVIPHDVAGLTLNVYLNGSVTPDQYVTDTHGMLSFQVERGYTYRIVFPEIEGCASIPDVVHTASVAQRSIEVEYKAAASVYETLTFIAHKSTDSSAFSGVSMVVTYDGEGHTYTTGSDGKVTAQIPLGKSYSVALQRPTGYYFLGGSSFNYTAEQSQRIIYGRLASANIGVFIVCSNGDEITLDNWSTSGHVATDAIAIKIATTELYDNNGVFAISIDEMGVTQNTSYPRQKWSSVNALFTSIPTITAVSQTDKPYYYDGYTASQLIQTEGDVTGNDTPAVDWALAKSLTLSGIEHQGFLLSLGQMTILWQNSAEIDAILDTVRPTHAYTLRGLSDTKWTSTQRSATNSWGFPTAQGHGTKSSSLVVVVAYAF